MNKKKVVIQRMGVKKSKQRRFTDRRRKDQAMQKRLKERTNVSLLVLSYGCWLKTGKLLVVSY